MHAAEHTQLHTQWVHAMLIQQSTRHVPVLLLFQNACCWISHCITCDALPTWDIHAPWVRIKTVFLSWLVCLHETHAMSMYENVCWRECIYHQPTWSSYFRSSVTQTFVNYLCARTVRRVEHMLDFGSIRFHFKKKTHGAWLVFTVALLP